MAKKKTPAAAAESNVATIDLPVPLNVEARAQTSVSILLSTATVETLPPMDRDVVLGEQADAWLDEAIATLKTEREEEDCTGADRREIDADLDVLTSEVARRAALRGEAPVTLDEDGADDLWDAPDDVVDEDDDEPTYDEQPDSGEDSPLPPGMSHDDEDDLDEANPPISEREATAPIDDEGPGEPITGGEIVSIELSDIEPDPDQPRQDVDDELADSIKAQGVLQPIRVRPHPYAGQLIPNASAKPITYPPFMIVDGERRWRGAKKAGRALIPAIVEINDRGDAGDRLLRQVTFNEGKRLAPMEEAKAWKRIMDAKGWNIQQLATALGRAKSTVSDRLALLDAPKPFQPLFEDGTLTAAAAPLVRQFSELPDAVVAKIVESAQEDYNWHQAVQRRQSVPLEVVKRAVMTAFSYPFQEVEQAHADYSGATFDFKGKKYAIDRSAYWKFTAEKQQKASSSKGASKGGAKAPDDWQKRQAEDERKRREKAERDKRIRRAQVDAVNAKLPPELSGPWALLVIERMVNTGNDDAIAQLLGIPAPKTKSSYGHSFVKQIMAHADKLDAKGRQRLILQILLADEMESIYGEPRMLKKAAQLARVDLKKIKAPDPAKAEKPAAAKKKAAKKGGRR